MPEGLHFIKKINYEEKSSLVNALRGQDVLVITLSGFAGKDIHGKLVDAAIETGVRYILPNERSPDTANESPKSSLLPSSHRSGRGSHLRVKIAPNTLQ